MRRIDGGYAMRKAVLTTGFIIVGLLCFFLTFNAALGDELSAAKESLRAKIELVHAEIAYLDSEHTAGDKIWQQYKNKANDLVKTCLKQIDKPADEVQGSLAKLEKMQNELNQLSRRIPLRLPSGPKGKSRFGAYYTTLKYKLCLLYTSPSPRDATLSRMPSSA